MSEMPKAVSRLLTECWDIDPIKRPTMRAIGDRLSALREVLKDTPTAATKQSQSLQEQQQQQQHPQQQSSVYYIPL